MKSNLNSIDRIARIIIAIVIAAMYFTQMITGTLAIVLLVAGAVIALTSFISFCPIYYILGISTNKKVA